MSATASGQQTTDSGFRKTAPSLTRMKHDLQPCTGAADVVPSFFQKSPLDVLPFFWDWVNWLAVDVNGVTDTIVSAVKLGLIEPFDQHGFAESLNARFIVVDAATTRATLAQQMV
jgi:hypothetical protein